MVATANMAALQWGRSHETAERTLASVPFAFLGDGFNGAAVMRLRKEVRSRFGSHGNCSFNGAAVMRLRKAGTRLRRSSWRTSFNGAAVMRLRKEFAVYPVGSERLASGVSRAAG